jgi:hypothetical protein
LASRLRWDCGQLSRIGRGSVAANTLVEPVGATAEKGQLQTETVRLIAMVHQTDLAGHETDWIAVARAKLGVPRTT